MFVIKYKKFFIGISIALVALSLVSIAVFGLKPGIDFTGGSALGLTYTSERPDIKFIQSSIKNAGFGDSTVQQIGERSVSIKTRELDDEERQGLIYVATHNGTNPATQDSFTAIGPSVGVELKKKAIISIVGVLIAIVLFVAYVFRKVSKPVSSWKYGFAVILALLHDICIPTGVFAILGYVYGFEVDTLFIVALLTTLALSISDTIVVFDRIRENLRIQNDSDKNEKQSFEALVGESLSQTLVRSFNTSMMVVIMVVSLAVFGPKSTQLFATILAIGMFVGTYSSIFLASPLLVLMETEKKKN